MYVAYTSAQSDQCLHSWAEKPLDIIDTSMNNKEPDETVKMYTMI